MGKPVITESQEVMLAYLSSWGPIGSEISFNVQNAAIDLGYLDHRSFYIVLAQLKALKLAELLYGHSKWGVTSFVCHARPEDCAVIVRSGSLIAIKRSSKRLHRAEKKPRVRAPIVKTEMSPDCRPLIPYVGKEAWRA